MPLEADLLRAVTDAPDDDAPRLAYADFCDAQGDPRGQLIRLQLRVAAAEEAGAPTAFFRPWEYEADALVSAHGKTWSAALCPPCSKPVFLRGFVEHVTLAARDFLARATDLFAQAPIRHLDLTGTRDLAKDLFASPHLAKIRSLRLDRFGLGDDEMVLLAGSKHLGELAWLDLMRNGIDMDGARALAASKNFPKLRYIGFFGNAVDPTEEIFTDQGIVVDKALPPEGRKLEAEFGPIPWLHVDAHTSWDVPPRRY